MIHSEQEIVTNTQHSERKLEKVEAMWNFLNAHNT